MITVIIAGGSGTRLWPLSTSQYPKHFLNLVDDESLLQATYRRAKKISPRDIYVVTAGEGQLALVREQLPELSDENFIVEPDRRDTAGCFVIALHHIQSRHDHDEPIAFIHADHYVRDIEGYAYSFKVAEAASRAAGRVALVGIEPTYPATGFGYIQRGSVEGTSYVHKVLRFKEKPDFNTAQDYLQSGEYLWNAGYFVGSVNTFLQTMEQFAPELRQNYDKLAAAEDEDALREAFLSFDKIAIDYALMEKAQNLLVVPASFDWMDVGSFADAHKVAETDQSGNFMKGYVEIEGVENSYLRNEEDKPIAVIGLDNIVVVNTPNGILVARKDLSQNVKTIATKVQEQKK